jgi:dolichol-phosphate mannosyltransferase
MDLVISPTLNEAENIDELIDSVLATQGFELLIVDDDSADGTWKRVQDRIDSTPRLHLVHRKSDAGFGKSYLDGFRWAFEHNADRVFTMDADLSHRAQYLPAMRDALTQGADVVIGSRYTRGGGIQNWSRRRLLISRFANAFAKSVTRLPVRDCTAGFLGIRAEMLRKIRLDSLTCNSYGFLIELKHALWRAGAGFTEVPIIFHDRTRGRTKFNSGMIGEAVKTCFRLRRAGKFKDR